MAHTFTIQVHDCPHLYHGMAVGAHAIDERHYPTLTLIQLGEDGLDALLDILLGDLLVGIRRTGVLNKIEQIEVVLAASGNWSVDRCGMAAA